MLSYRLLDVPLTSGNIPCRYFAALQGCIVHPSMSLVSKNTFKMSFYSVLHRYNRISLVFPYLSQCFSLKEQEKWMILKTYENITYTHQLGQVFDVDKFYGWKSSGRNLFFVRGWMQKEQSLGFMKWQWVMVSVLRRWNQTLEIKCIVGTSLDMCYYKC